MHNYKGKITLVTGGNSGIGREITRQLADLGATVVVWGRNAQTGNSLVEELTISGKTVTFSVVDVQEATQVKTGMDTLMQQHGRLDYVFHCAGIILGGEIRDHSIDDITAVMQTNVLGTSHVAFYAYRIMAQQGFGHLVNVSSGAGIFPVPLMGVYSASKFAVYGLSEAMRMEAKSLGVRVSVVAPGLVDTPIFERGRYSRTDKPKTLSTMKRLLYMIQPDQAARTILRGTGRNRAVIHTQLYVRFAWVFYRYAPHLFRFVASQSLVEFRRRYRTPD